MSDDFTIDVCVRCSKFAELRWTWKRATTRSPVVRTFEKRQVSTYAPKWNWMRICKDMMWTDTLWIIAYRHNLWCVIDSTWQFLLVDSNEQAHGTGAWVWAWACARACNGALRATDCTQPDTQQSLAGAGGRTDYTKVVHEASTIVCTGSEKSI